VTRRRRTIAFISVALLALAASTLACLVLLRTPQGNEAKGDVSRLRSPDARWVLTEHYVETGLLASNPALSRGVLTRTDGSEARMIYLGEPAVAQWQGSTSVMFTEQESGRRHVVAVSGGAYDYRFDEPLNLAAFVLYTVVPGAVVLLVGSLIIRRRSRPTSRRATAWPLQSSSE
jgi:hypothetical protein